MAVNPYFNTLFSEGEKQLFEDMNVEVIQQSGFDVVYIPKKFTATDEILNEVISAEYQAAARLEVFLEQAGGFSPTDFSIDRFGLMFAGAQTRLSFSKRRFREEVNQEDLEVPGQPNIGDLIYLPPQKQFYEIVDVDLADPFLSGGSHFLFIVNITHYRTSHIKKFSEDLENGGYIDVQTAIDGLLRENDFSAEHVDDIRENEIEGRNDDLDSEKSKTREERDTGFGFY